MRCPFCGKAFDEESARESCGSCAVFGGCRNVKCPHCGYESPEEPGLVKWFKRKLGKAHDKSID